MSIRILQNEDITGLEELSGAVSGRIVPIPTNEANKFSAEQIRLFLHKYGLYTLPTVELIEYLSAQINGRRAIEIGAGLGVIGRSLGIPITDNKMQSWPEIKAHYALMRQPTIEYPRDVVELDAIKAVKKYRPQVVIGSYITHKWRPGMSSGNMYGVDTVKLIRSVNEYMMIGSMDIHLKNDPAMAYLDGIEQHDFLITRSDRDRSVIFRWKKQ